MAKPLKGVQQGKLGITKSLGVESAPVRPQPDDSVARCRVKNSRTRVELFGNVVALGAQGNLGVRVQESGIE